MRQSNILKMPKLESVGATASSAKSAGSSSAPLLMLFASKAKSHIECARFSFEKYLSSGGLGVDVLVGPEDLWDAVQKNHGSDRSLILWDASAGMPPKEIEMLIHGLSIGEWRAGVRHAPLSVCRGGSGRERKFGLALGSLRRLAGLVSDSHPPCLALPLSFVRSHQNLLSTAPEADWVSLLIKASRRNQIRIVEAPVMWAKRYAE